MTTQWVPDACTLPTSQVPLRVREFDDLFARHLRRTERRSPAMLRLTFDPSPRAESTLRDLTDRESRCCSFFTFDIDRSGGRLILDITVPDGREDVLDGLSRQADGVIAGRP